MALCSNDTLLYAREAEEVAVRSPGRLQKAQARHLLKHHSQMKAREKVLVIHTAVADTDLEMAHERMKAIGDKQSHRDMNLAMGNAIWVVRVMVLDSQVAVRLPDSKAVGMLLGSLVAEKEPGDMAVGMLLDNTSSICLGHSRALVSASSKAFFPALRSEP